jgi:dTDP-glucose 4,6-dehydratase
MHVLVTGCAGLIGSHLAEALIARGDTVIGVDDFCTGRRANLSSLSGHPGFELIEGDLTAPGLLDPLGPVDAVAHLASPASPRDFTTMPLDILRVGSVGTFVTAELALRHGARYVLASTSEVYGEPAVHPQPETYHGNVNPVGPRACYDEAKRFAEATVSSYRRSAGLDGAIARIFNTYGPRMRIDDGRVVSNFVVQALAGQPITIQGDGSQTRAFCHVRDLVRGLLAVIDSDVAGPVNLGNPATFTIAELADLVLELTGSRSPVEFRPLPTDDPTRREPDITLARTQLGWEPAIGLREGLVDVIDHFRTEAPT